MERRSSPHCALLLAQIHNTLASLDLCGNSIGDRGALAIADAVKGNRQLRCLSIAENQLGPEGVSKLCRSLASCPLLKSLDLSGNPVWIASADHRAAGDEALLCLGALLCHSPSISVLKLESCNLDNGRLSALCHGIANVTTLEILNLADNDIGLAGVTRLAAALKVRPTCHGPPLCLHVSPFSSCLNPLSVPTRPSVLAARVCTLTRVFRVGPCHCGAEHAKAAGA